MAGYATPDEVKRRRAAVEAAYYELGDNVLRISERIGLDRAVVRRHMRALGLYDKPLSGGSVHSIKPKPGLVPRRGVRRYLLTAAQNNTDIFGPFWVNLQALSDHLGARLLVGTISYNANNFQKMSAKRGAQREQSEMWFAPELVRHFCDERVELAPGLVWCGEMNISPTAVNPLSGLQTYSGGASAIFPHTKVMLESVATAKHDPAKINATTGVVTQRHYIPRKAGLKADFHHTYAAAIVEVDSDGDWFLRQVVADDSGDIHDLDVRVADGKVSTGVRIENFTAGDFHAARVDPVAAEAVWGAGGLVDALRPRSQCLHDVLDFVSRNHHEAKDVHKRLKRLSTGQASVEDELRVTVDRLRAAHRPRVETVVVDSNHDNALTRWLREADPRRDELNLEVYSRLQARLAEAIARREDDFHLVEWALRERGLPKAIRFLRRDEKYLICGEIDCGNHGDIGPNGSRGSIRSLAKVGAKQNIGHSHSAGIYEGVYQAPTMSLLDMDYNLGPSSWSQGGIVTYANRKRSLVLLRNGKWRAGMKAARPGSVWL